MAFSIAANQSTNFGVQLLLPFAETLSDNFNDNSLDTSKWDVWNPGDVSETSQTLHIQSTTASSYKGMQSVAKFDLTSSYVHVEVPHVLTGLSSASTCLQVAADDQHTLTLYSDGSNLVAEYQINGVYTNSAAITYNASTHRWWRIREASGTVYYEYSSNASTWTAFASLAAPFSVTSVLVVLFIGTDVANGSTDTAIFDNLNALPVAMATIKDDFDDNSLDGTKWIEWSVGDVSETSQTLQIQSTTAASYKGVAAATPADLTGSYVHVEVVHALSGISSAGTYLQTWFDNQNSLSLFVYSGTLMAETQVGDSYTTLASTTYNASTHRWWRIREASGTIYYEYSANGLTWTVFASVATPFALDSLIVQLFIGTDSSNASTDTAVFDNLNTASMQTASQAQYNNDQWTAIAVGGSTTGDGVSNNVWLETDVRSNLPSNDTTLSVEVQSTSTSFTNTATVASTPRSLKTTYLPTYRRGGAMIYDAKNERFILFGGYDGSTRYNEVWEISADSAYHRWKKLSPSGTPPTAKNLAASVYARGTTSGSVDKAYMVIWGGSSPSDLNEMHALDISTPGSETWSTISQTGTPSTRSYLTHHMVLKTTGTNTSDIYLFGGWGTSRFNDLYRCTFNVNSPTSVTWTTLKANGATGNPTIRSGCGVVHDSANDRLIISGGYSGSSYLADVWQYSISGGSFTQLTPSGVAPGGRELGAMSYDVNNQRALIVGGWQGSASTNRNDIVELSLTSGSEAWTTIKSNDLNNQSMLAVSSICSAVDTARNMAVYATPYGYDSTTKYVYVYDLTDTNSTATMYSLNMVDYFRSRDAPSVVYNSGRDETLFINGYGTMDDDATVTRGDHIAEIWAYNHTTNMWRYAVRGSFVVPQCEGALSVYDAVNDRVIFFGGLTGNSRRSNDAWELKADAYGNYKVTKLSPSGTRPGQRWLMAGCYDTAHGRMILWGGQDNGIMYSDVWALDLTSGSEAWTQLTPSGTGPTATWQSCYAYDSANNRLYIHGGTTNDAGTTFTSQLFYLDLSTTNGAWTDTGVTGGLAVRGAVMGYDASNQRLICFGGYDGSVVNNTVRYASTSSFSSWTTQSTANTPGARRSAGAFVVDGKFIVAAGRPVSGTWFSDTQELNANDTPSSWSWTNKDPAIYQPLAVGVSGLALGTSYHWQSWATTSSGSSTYSSFGANAEDAADFIVSSGVGGQIKVWSGSAFVARPVRVWDGSGWTIKPAKTWNGSSWVETSY